VTPSADTAFSNASSSAPRTRTPGRSGDRPADEPARSPVNTTTRDPRSTREGPSYGNFTRRPAVEHPAARPDPLHVGGIITPEPYVPNLKTLREKIDQDTKLLSSLDPTSDAYRRLQARITDQTTQLLDYEDTLEQRRQQAAIVEAKRTRANEQGSAVGCGLLLVVAGVLAVVLGWGTWWIAAGLVSFFLAFGAFAHAKDI
jgi:hypothetical protein